MANLQNYLPSVIQALQQRGVKGECPCCKKNSWLVHHLPVGVPVFEQAGELKIPGTTMPFAAMICRQCGWTGFFSLGALGLIGAGGTGGEPPAAGEPKMDPPTQSS